MLPEPIEWQTPSAAAPEGCRSRSIVFLDSAPVSVSFAPPRLFSDLLPHRAKLLPLCTPLRFAPYSRECAPADQGEEAQSARQPSWSGRARLRELRCAKCFWNSSSVILLWPLQPIISKFGHFR